MNSYFYELAIHTPLCVLVDPKRVLLIGGAADDRFMAEIAKHTPAPEAVVALEPNGRFDVVFDLRATPPDERLNGALTDRGIMIKACSALDRDQLAAFSSFRYVQPFGFSTLASETPLFRGLLFASRRYHPTADLKLQKADMLEGLSYYSADMHTAAFVLPPALLISLGDALKL